MRVKFLDHRGSLSTQGRPAFAGSAEAVGGKKNGKRLPLNFWHGFFAQESELNQSGPSCSGGGTERISTHAEEDRRDLVMLENSSLLTKPHPERKEAPVGADLGGGVSAGEGFEIWNRKTLRT